VSPKLRLAIAVFRFGFFLTSLGYTVLWHGAGLHAHPAFRALMIGWASLAALTYVADATHIWRSRAS